MQLKMTIETLIEVWNLSEYKASSIEGAADHLMEWILEGRYDPLKIAKLSDTMFVTVSPHEETEE